MRVGSEAGSGSHPAGNLTLTVLPAGSRLAVLFQFAVGRDPVGNPTGIVRTGSAASTETSEYDPLDRLDPFRPDRASRALHPSSGTPGGLADEPT
jgi:hypothetical protein